MNRRSFLQILGAAGVAVVVAPKILVERALAPTLPVEGVLVTNAPAVVDGLQTISITFPDGSVWNMRGFVMSQFTTTRFADITTSEVEFRPSGPCECVEEARKASVITYNGTKVGEIQPITARGTTIRLDGKDLGEVQDIVLPQMERTQFDVTTYDGDDDYHVGRLKRISPLTFTVVNFAEPLL